MVNILLHHIVVACRVFHGSNQGANHAQILRKFIFGFPITLTDSWNLNLKIILACRNYLQANNFTKSTSLNTPEALAPMILKGAKLGLAHTNISRFLLARQ